jgi:hypothetical protein
MIANLNEFSPKKEFFAKITIGNFKGIGERFEVDLKPIRIEQPVSFKRKLSAL